MSENPTNEGVTLFQIESTGWSRTLAAGDGFRHFETMNNFTFRPIDSFGREIVVRIRRDDREQTDRLKKKP